MCDIFQVDQKVWKKAAELFGRNEESLNEDVETIKNWLLTQPHLPEIMEDIKIKNFLLLNKCSIEKTKQKIDMYYTVRSLLPDMFEECNPKLPCMREFMEIIYFGTHPKLIDDLYRVHLCKLKETKTMPKEYFLQFVNYAEIRLYEDCMVGDIYISDLTNYTISEMTKVTPTLLSKMVTILKEVFSMRFKKMYFINSPPFISSLLKLLKGVLKPKIFDRIEVHEDTEILKTIFEKKDLPKDYGGDGPSLEEMHENTKIKLAEYQDRFDVLDKLRVNESLRPEKLDNSEILGFYGNFKKIDVD